MSETTMIGPITKKLRSRLKVFLAEFDHSYEEGIVILLDLFDNSR